MSENCKLKMMVWALSYAFVFCYSEVFAQEEFESQTSHLEREVNVHADLPLELASERIVVTGSRISRIDAQQPVPMLMIDAEQLMRAATPDLGSILAELPYIGASETLSANATDIADAGLSSLDLRHLDAKRTLVLVNGKRQVAGSAGSIQVDLATIPVTLIERVEVITGGAAAIYGSDALAGVVNVILKQDFQGIEFNAMSSRALTDVNADNHSLSLVAGFDVNDGRGNLSVYATHENIDQTTRTDLPQSANWGPLIEIGDGEHQIDYKPNMGQLTTHQNGVLLTQSFDQQQLWVLDATGQRVQAQCEALMVNDYGNSGSYLPEDCRTAVWLDSYKDYLPSVKRINLGVNFNYDVTDNLLFFGDFNLSKADIRQQKQAPSVTFTASDVALPLLFDGPLADELADIEVFSVTKQFKEFDGSEFNTERELFRYSLGIEGEGDWLATNFAYELFYIMGRTRDVRVINQDLIEGNLFAAIDVVIDPLTNELACRSQVPSAQYAGFESSASVDAANCVVYNPLGFNQATADAVDWITGTSTVADVIEQQVFGGSIATDSSQWFSLAGGPLSFAAGFEYRKERYGISYDRANGYVASESGEYEVIEHFFELSAPILSDYALAYDLTLDMAIRFGDYTHTHSAETWKLGLLYAPVADLRFRATRSYSVRAPNLVESFRGIAKPNEEFMTDLCVIEVASSPIFLSLPNEEQSTEQRQIKCAQWGMPDGFIAYSGMVDIEADGNPDLAVERSMSTTLGVIWQPEFLSGFYWSLDHYAVVIDDAIEQLTGSQALENCLSAGEELMMHFCDAIVRDPNSFVIEHIHHTFFNVEVLKVEGIESDIRYFMPLKLFDIDGELKLSLFVSQLKNLAYNASLENVAGRVGEPKWQAKASVQYGSDDFSVNWSLRYIDSVSPYEAITIADSEVQSYQPSQYASIVTQDLSLVYRLSDDIQLNAGVRNVFNELPAGYVQHPMYDHIGRRAFLGVKMNMDW